MDRTRCTSERETSVDFWSVPLKSMSIFIWPSSFSVFLHIPNRGRTWTSPYDCRLRVNFHCWLRLWLQTSTVSPPILALRLSRQRLLPTWRSFELDSICSHFCWHTMIHIIKKNLVLQTLHGLILLATISSAKHLECKLLPVCCHSLDSLVVWWGNWLFCPLQSDTSPCVWLTYP